MALYPIARHRLIRQSFVHLAGVGPRTEAHLWKQGIIDWTDLLEAAPGIFKAKRLDGILRSLDDSLAAWEKGDAYFFHQALPGNERWRLIPGTFDDIAYFDIEATGGSMPPVCESTAVAFYFRGQLIQAHEHRQKRDLIEWILEECSLLCTYNGAAYDVPFLKAEYGIPFHKAHVDLCPWLRRLGFKGGLKAIQKAMPHLPQRDSMDIDGFDAVRLWAMHIRGVSGALETLLTYNAEDALILEPLLVEAYARELENYPQLQLETLSSAPQPALTTTVDPMVYSLLRGSPAVYTPRHFAFQEA